MGEFVSLPPCLLSYSFGVLPHFQSVYGASNVFAIVSQPGVVGSPSPSAAAAAAAAIQQSSDMSPRVSGAIAGSVLAVALLVLVAAALVAARCRRPARGAKGAKEHPVPEQLPAEPAPVPE